MPDRTAADIALCLAVATDDDIDEAIVDSLASLAASAGSDRAYVTSLHDDDTFENSHEWTRIDVVPQKPVIQQFQVSDFPYSVDLARRDQVLAVLDVGDLPNAARPERESFSAFGVRAVLQVPIRVGGRTVGLVGYNDFEPRPGWADTIVTTTRTVGQAIGIALGRRTVLQEADDARQALHQADRAIDELLARFSHELRTPLHAILGYAELLELDDRPDHERQALFEIQINGRRLLNMVEDLIALSDDADGHGEHLSRLAPAIATAIDTLVVVAEARQVRFELSPAVDTIVIHVEPGRLRQVVYGTLSGALQSLIGGGVIRIDAAPGELSVSVHGTGPVATTGLVMPITRALMSGHGRIDVNPGADRHSVQVVLSFDQFARP